MSEATPTPSGEAKDCNDCELAQLSGMGAGGIEWLHRKYHAQPLPSEPKCTCPDFPYGAPDGAFDGADDDCPLHGTEPAQPLPSSPSEAMELKKRLMGAWRTEYHAAMSGTPEDEREAAEWSKKVEAEFEAAQAHHTQQRAVEIVETIIGENEKPNTWVQANPGTVAPGMKRATTLSREERARNELRAEQRKKLANLKKGQTR